MFVVRSFVAAFANPYFLKMLESFVFYNAGDLPDRSFAMIGYGVENDSVCHNNDLLRL